MEAVQIPKYMKDKEYEAAAAAENAAKAATAATTEVKELSFDELLATKVPAIEVVDMGVKYKGHNPESKLLQHHSSKASILQRSAFFIVQLSHPHMTTGNFCTDW